jgi:hypothetical protein
MGRCYILSILILELFVYFEFGITYMFVQLSMGILIAVPLIAVFLDAIINNMGEEAFFSFIITIMVVIAIITLCFLQFGHAIGVAQDYNAAYETVEECKELLLKYETNDSLPYGMEAWELKSTLKDAIEEKNTCKSRINGWLNNPYENFKGIIRSNLKYPL